MNFVTRNRRVYFGTFCIFIESPVVSGTPFSTNAHKVSAVKCVLHTEISFILIKILTFGYYLIICHRALIIKRGYIRRGLSRKKT